MPRPIKPRYYEGVLLAENLYTHNSKRPGHWRYKRPDGTYKGFEAKTVHEANEIAAYNNARRENYTKVAKAKKLGVLAAYVPEYIEEREKLSPDLALKQSWYNRKRALLLLANEIPLPLPLITIDVILIWWNGLTHHQQKLRHPEFRKFFNFLMQRKLLVSIDSNPFTTNDDKPRLYFKSPKKRKAQRLTRDSFWLIYDCAGQLGYECLQIAMGISLTTFMREGDICSLKLSKNIEDNLLKKTIGKSLSQKGVAKAARLQWDVANYDLLRQLINRARELSLQHRACPFVISHIPERHILGKKEHIAQVLPRRLISMFDEARKMAGFTGDDAPTFHGVRSLATALANEAGYTDQTIQQATAHSSIDMVHHYQSGHELPHTNVAVQFNAEQIGRNFK